MDYFVRIRRKPGNIIIIIKIPRRVVPTELYINTFFLFKLIILIFSRNVSPTELKPFVKF